MDSFSVFPVSLAVCIVRKVFLKDASIFIKDKAVAKEQNKETGRSLGECQI